MSEERKVIGFWRPNDSGGYEKRHQEAYFDGTHLEVNEIVGGRGVHCTRVVIPKALLVQMLSEHDLYIVNAKDKLALDELSRSNILQVPGFGPVLSAIDDVAVSRIELARREEP